MSVSARGTTAHASFVHVPVLLRETIEGLRPRPGGRYVDCTYGRGGHTRALLARLSAAGRVLALDRDRQAVSHGEALMSKDSRFTIKHASFAQLQTLVDEWGALGEVDGIMADLGVSSPQVDDAGRGFSIARDGPLDMRMDQATGQSAAEWLAEAEAREIERVLRTYGEERFSRRIAAAIVRARAQAPLSTTEQLARIVADAVPAPARRQARLHPATRVFQAIRIHINAELEQLEALLIQAGGVLRVGGRLAVISFHSLEDRLVKRAMRASGGPKTPRHLPLRGELPDRRQWRELGKPTRAADAEVAANPRARSAVLRVAERLH